MTPGIQLSTVISDGVFAAVTFVCAVKLISKRNVTRTFGAACMLFVGIAAAFGAARYGGADVIVYHESLSWTARMIAIPVMGAVSCALAFGWRLPRYGWYAVGLVFGAAGWLLPLRLGVLPSAAGMALFLLGAARVSRVDRRSAIFVVVGVALYLVAGLVVGTHGAYGPVQRVDVFHVMLTIAHPLFTSAMIAADRRAPSTGRTGQRLG